MAPLNPDASNFGQAAHPAISRGDVDGRGERAEPDSLLKFDLSSIASAITRAALKLYGHGVDATYPHRVYLAEDNWDEGSLIWRNAPRLGQELGRLEAPSPGVNVFELSVDEVEAEAWRDGLLSLAVISDGASWVSYHSSDADDPTRHPVLEVEMAPKTMPEAYVWKEAEAHDGSAFDPFEIVTDAGASCGAYIEVTPGVNAYDAPPSDGYAEYDFTLAQAASVAIWLRVAYPSPALPVTIRSGWMSAAMTEAGASLMRSTRERLGIGWNGRRRWAQGTCLPATIRWRLLAAKMGRN